MRGDDWLECLWLTGYFACHVETGALLKTSHGHSKYGAPPWRGLIVPIPPAAQRADKDGYIAYVATTRFRATSEDDAVARADAWIAKHADLFAP